ncbi:hypothetical protein U1872_05885 [Sphingomonas sp. RB3P16]|uniref:hypothetical protein n=1 Tax=Parasphingomonas frigoris TaxID=3096163 RepID=UPI002FC9569A
MAFREKMSWLSLGGILLAFGPYFFSLTVLGQPPSALSAARAGPFLGVILVLVCAMIVASIAVALSNLRDAQAPSDERDRLIARRAVAISYPVLLTAIFAALATLFFGAGQAVLVNAILGAIVLGELTRCGVEVAGYRARG